MASLEQFFAAAWPAKNRALRVALEPGRAARLPDDCTVEVLAGHVWISFAGEDRELALGEKASFPKGVDVPVASSLGRTWAMVSVEWTPKRGAG